MPRTFLARILSPVSVILFAFALSACSPQFDWREVRGQAAPYQVLLPAKPATHARDIDLDGLPLTMTMTGAEVDSVTFAVGSVELADPGQAAHAIAAMKTALVRNIGGTVAEEKLLPPGANPVAHALEAHGPLRDGRRILLARFLAKERHVYQLLVVGPEASLSREAAETFFDSFRAR